MKLYLSSYRLGDERTRLSELAGANRSAIVIANSMDFIDGIARRECVEREIDDLAAEGFYAEEVDLREYFGNSDELEARLATSGLIWVRGGNVFILRRAMAESGFDDWLSDHVDNDDLVYGGYSAGVCVLGRTLKGFDIVDSPEQVPPGYPSEVRWDGLGVIDFSIAPHYRSDHPESAAIEDVVSYLEIHEIEYKTLRDGDVLIIE